MAKWLVFDMDGTIADLYHVPGWKEDLQAGSTRPYEIAKPLYDMKVLAGVLRLLKAHGYGVAVVTWLAKKSTIEFLGRSAVAKKEWLNRYEFPYDEFYPLLYGMPKQTAMQDKGFCILFDDDWKVRRDWDCGKAIDATKNIYTELNIMLLHA